MRFRWELVAVCVFVCISIGVSISFAATIGTVVPMIGGAVDIVVDNARGRLYVVGVPDKVEVYSIPQRRFLTPIQTDALPLAADISRDGRFLYVACHNASSLNIIDLETLAIVGRVSLPARPEGVAVGADERVLISTIGTGANNVANVLLLYDRAQGTNNALSAIAVTPSAPTPPQLPPPAGRPFLANRSLLRSNATGSVIVGVNIPNANSRSVFVYEVASATVLRSRTVAAISSVLSVSPDGSRFMAGLTLFDTQTMEVLAQQNLANAPYPIQPGTNFNVQQNQGGSVFSPDGATLYSAFNIAPVQNPVAPANASQMMLNDPDNLLIRMGLQMPENLAGKMVISADGANIFALSESGFMILPVGTVPLSPLAMPDSSVLLLANDQCGVASDQRTQRVAVANQGRGNLGQTTAQVLQLTPAGPAGLGGAAGPGGGIPGGGGVVIIIPGVPGGGIDIPAPIPIGGQQPAQNPAIAGSAPTLRAQQTPAGPVFEFSFNALNARALGTASPNHDFLIQSAGAINIPPRVRVYQNNRDTDARATVIPIPVGISANEALEDLAYDATRQRIYIANSGLNRVEVFDARRGELMTPIKVGQLPRSLALSPDGGTLYVANSGGESITVIDPNRGEVTGRVRFPPIPFNVNAPLVTPSVIVPSLRGPQVMMNNGTLWKIVGDEIVPRNLSPIIGTATIAAPRSMTATPNGEYILLLAGNGFVYLYDALSDEFVQGRQIFTAQQLTGYFGPVAAGPRGQYYVVNGTVLNQALTPISRAATGLPVSAVAPVGASTFVRFAQPVRANANALPADAPQVELVDATSGQVMRRSPALEGPLSTQVGNQRVNVGSRTMAVDANGSTVYSITASGLSIVPLDPVAPADRPLPNPAGTVSLGSYLPTFAPGGLVSIFGRNLAGSAVASTTPLPTMMGGACVTLNNVALPLFMTSPEQINAQIPPEMAAGRYALVVRSIDRKAPSAAQQITVSRYAPAVLVDPPSGQPAIFHSDGRPVTRSSPAKRDQRLTLYAIGLGATRGGRVTAGVAAPREPLATVDNVEVFFGDPRYREAEIIVEWSGLVPGFVGLYQVNLYVPGDHIRGDAVPVTLRVGGVDSQKTGPVVPTIAVD